MFIGFKTQPSDQLPEISQGEVTTERSAEYEGSVTCHEDCQVTFGFESEDNLGADESDQSTKAETYSASRLAYLDLIAQRRMAHWAIILALLTAIGAGLLIATLLETANASDAAVNTEQTTREIGEAQARAHLSCPSGIFKICVADESNIELVINVFNSGNSPARSIELEAIVIVEYVEDDEPIVAVRYPLPPLKIDDIGGGETQPKRAKVTDANKMWAQYLLARNAEIGVYGSIRFTDVFKKEWPKRIALAGHVERRVPNTDGNIVNDMVPCHPDRWDNQKAQG